MPLRYPQSQRQPLPFKMPTPLPISVLDYNKGFGHTDLVVC